jgi:hypothetical protein
MDVVVIALAAVQIALYVGIAAGTLGYPYPLEWMEGGSLDVVRRVREALPIYTRPTAAYVPYIYPPLYYVVVAAATLPFGVDFLAARLISFLSVCGACGLIFGFIRREGASHAAALAGVGIFIGTYEASGRWFHLARVDSLFLLVVLAAFYAMRFFEGWRGALAAALLFWLAFLTKQTALVIAAIALPIAALGTPRRALGIGATVASLVLATNLVADARTHHWWHYFIYTLPTRHPIELPLLKDFWRDIVVSVPAAVAGAALLLGSGGARPRRVFYTALVVSMVAASGAARVHTGGWLNDLICAFAGLAIAAPIGIELSPRMARARVFGLALLAAQLALPLVFAGRLLRHAVPTAGDRAAGDRFVEFLGGVDGEVIVWNQRFVETRAGKKSWGLEMAATDVLRSSDDDLAGALRTDVIHACLHGNVAGVINPPDWLADAVPFAPPVDLFGDRHVFVPITGRPERPSRYFAVLRR